LRARPQPTRDRVRSAHRLKGIEEGAPLGFGDLALRRDEARDDRTRAHRSFGPHAVVDERHHEARGLGAAAAKLAQDARVLFLVGSHFRLQIVGFTLHVVASEDENHQIDPAAAQLPAEVLGILVVEPLGEAADQRELVPDHTGHVSLQHDAVSSRRPAAGCAQLEAVRPIGEVEDLDLVARCITAGVDDLGQLTVDLQLKAPAVARL
jgi:hypothetical protein